MEYSNNGKKFAAVLNRKHTLPVALNALAHAAYGLASKIVGGDSVLDYPNASSDFLARISEYPFIILEAKNSSQLHSLLGHAVRNDSLDYNVFTTSMIGASAADQLEATRQGTSDTLDFVIVVLFGEREQVDMLTRKFSLLKS